jgi:heme exporter protein CcmD
MPDLHVGAYGAYIWPAFGLTVLILAWMVVDTLVRAARWKARAQGSQADRPPRNGPVKPPK